LANGKGNRRRQVSGVEQERFEFVPPEFASTFDRRGRDEDRGGDSFCLQQGRRRQQVVRIPIVERQHHGRYRVLLGLIVPEVRERNRPRPPPDDRELFGKVFWRYAQ